MTRHDPAACSLCATLARLEEDVRELGAAHVSSDSVRDVGSAVVSCDICESTTGRLVGGVDLPTRCFDVYACAARAGIKVVQPLSPASRPTTNEARWRTGRTIRRNLYRDGAYVGVVGTPELAAEIVAAMTGPRTDNARRPSREEVIAWSQAGPPEPEGPLAWSPLPDDGSLDAEGVAAVAAAYARPAEVSPELARLGDRSDDAPPRRPDLEEVLEYLERRQRAASHDAAGGDDQYALGAAGAYGLAIDYVRGARFDVPAHVETSDDLLSLAREWLTANDYGDAEMDVPSLAGLLARVRDGARPLPANPTPGAPRADGRCSLGPFGTHSPAMHGMGCAECDAEHVRVVEKHLGPSCAVSSVSSRMCERGTKGCTTVHHDLAEPERGLPEPEVVDRLYDVLEKHSTDSDGAWLAGDRIRVAIVTDLVGLWNRSETPSPDPDDRLDYVVGLFDEVCKWLAGHGHKPAADALHDARNTWLLPLARAVHEKGTEK